MKRTLSILLFPFGAIYGIIELVRRWLYRTGWITSYQSALPTICIGNLAVGGTGKTPLVEYLIRHFQTDRRVATLSRGYKRKTTGYLNSTDESVVASASTFGDEPTQLHHKFPDIQVVVCEDRAEGMRQLEHAATPPDIVLLDDAYQHLSVRCNLNLLLTDYACPYCDDFPMPAGRLREFPSAANNADAVIVTKCPNSLTKEEAVGIRKKLKLHDMQRCFFTTLQYDELVPITPVAKQIALAPDSSVILLTGIANSKPIQQEISKQFSDIEIISYSDHHSFTTKEMADLCKKTAEKGNDAVIITTEKDAARLRDTHICNLTECLPIFVLPVRVAFLFNEEEEFILMVKNIK